MSALAMILAAAMAVPGDGPEKVSGESERSPQPLDLRGQWKGTLRNHCEPWRIVELCGEILKVADEKAPGGVGYKVPVSITDEGNGELRMRLNGVVYLGIYRQESDRFIACFGKRRPSEFKLTEENNLISFHRVKSSK